MKKIIIIAAGSGFRLRPYTKQLPKGLLNVGKKSIIQNQIDIYRELNIKNINIVVGYKKNKFSFKKTNYFFNKNYKNNNILESLFYAKSEINKNCIISYSDIIFKKDVVKKLNQSNSDISIIVDQNWKKIYKGRTMHPVSEAEKVTFNKNNSLIDIGKDLKISKTNGEFIGLLKLNSKGCKIFKKYYALANKEFKNKKFFNSKNLKKAYITDFLRYLISKNIKIKCVIIKNNWMEIDTPQDLSRAQKFYK